MVMAARVAELTNGASQELRLLALPSLNTTFPNRNRSIIFPLLRSQVRLAKMLRFSLIVALIRYQPKID